MRPARQAGYPVIYGDSSDEDVLLACGIGTFTSTDDPAVPADGVILTGI